MRGVCQVALWPAASQVGTRPGPVRRAASRPGAALQEQEAAGGESALPVVLAGLLGAAGWKGYLLYKAGDLCTSALSAQACWGPWPWDWPCWGGWVSTRTPDPALVREKAAHRGFVARVRLLVVSRAQGGRRGRARGRSRPPGGRLWPL